MQKQQIRGIRRLHRTEEEDEDIVCPECGLPLCHSISKDKHGNMVIEVFCDDDHIMFKILTKISDEDIEELKRGKGVETGVTLKLQYRRPDAC